MIVDNGSNVTDVKPVQTAKQPPKDKLVTVEGMTMDVNPVQPWKQFEPKVVTEGGMVIDVNLVQPRTKKSSNLVTVGGMTIVVKPVQ